MEGNFSRCVFYLEFGGRNRRAVTLKWIVVRLVGKVRGKVRGKLWCPADRKGERERGNVSHQKSGCACAFCK